MKQNEVIELLSRYNKGFTKVTKTKKSNIAVRLNFAPLQGLEPWTL